MKALRIINLVILTFIFSLSAGNCEIVKGKPAPVFNLRNSRGELVKPFQESKPVLISFFFTDCPNCRKEIKELEALNEKFNDRVALYLVGTSFKNGVDVSEDVDNFIKELNVGLVPLVDKYKEAIKSYGVSQYPSLFLINSKGNVVYTSTSYNEKTIKELEKQIKTVK